MIHDLDTGTAVAVVSEDVFFSAIATREVSSRAVVYAGDYLNKLSGESVERECREKIADGATELIVDFSRTEIVNSIGVSILLGVIDAAKSNGASVVFKEVNESTTELFEMLGVTNHVRLIHN
ncbi:MAG: STAS domain-containing protein [Pyrinomonadaceae bacterium]